MTPHTEPVSFASNDEAVCTVILPVLFTERTVGLSYWHIHRCIVIKELLKFLSPNSHTLASLLWLQADTTMPLSKTVCLLSKHEFMSCLYVRDTQYVWTVVDVLFALHFYVPRLWFIYRLNARGLILRHVYLKDDS